MGRFSEESVLHYSYRLAITITLLCFDVKTELILNAYLLLFCSFLLNCCNKSIRNYCSLVENKPEH